MMTFIDGALRTEAALFRLKFGCADCAHYAAERLACAEEYPNEVHRDTRIEAAHSMEFCKSFELA